MGERKGVSRTNQDQLADQYRRGGGFGRGDPELGREVTRRGGELDAAEMDQALDGDRPMIGAVGMLVGPATTMGVMDRLTGRGDTPRHRPPSDRAVGETQGDQSRECRTSQPLQHTVPRFSAE